VNLKFVRGIRGTRPTDMEVNSTIHSRTLAALRMGQSHTVAIYDSIASHNVQQSGHLLVSLYVWLHIRRRKIARMETQTQTSSYSPRIQTLSNRCRHAILISGDIPVPSIHLARYHRLLMRSYSTALGGLGGGGVSSPGHDDRDVKRSWDGSVGYGNACHWHGKDL
jgi:hypothetical protein